MKFTYLLWRTERAPNNEMVRILVGIFSSFAKAEKRQWGSEIIQVVRTDKESPTGARMI